MMKSEQFRMTPGNQVRGWVCCGTDGVIAGSFGMTYEQVERQAVRIEQATGHKVTIHAAKLEVFGCSKGKPNG